MKRNLEIRSAGLFGFGAFGQLVARHLAPHVPLLIHDPAAPAGPPACGNARFAPVEEAARCDIVILAVPVSRIAAAARAVAPHLKPGAIVADVGSVKLAPARAMAEILPAHAEVLGTHPLFGPQSAVGGLQGRKITLCPVRGTSSRRIAALLRRVFGLRVFVTTAEEHDREAAMVQGLTHFIAKVLVRMEPLPTRLTTASFEHLMRAVDMVRHDAPEVFEAIERDNPFACGVRQRFAALVGEMDLELERG